MTKRICTICARGGSKGLPKKNSRLLLGKPLFAHSLEHALQASLFDVVVMTSDDPEILAYSKRYKDIEIVERPAHLAGDRVQKAPGVAHAVDVVGGRRGETYDTIIDLDVTSPLRLASDIVEVIKLVEEGGFFNAFTVAHSQRNPYTNMVREKADGSVEIVIKTDPPIKRRQDAPTIYDLNASVYAWRSEVFWPEPPLFTERTGVHVMPRERSIDIDELFDWRIVEFLMRHRAETENLAQSPQQST